MPANKVANATYDSCLDIIAITEHNKITDSYLKVREEINELTYNTNKDITVLLGIEVSIKFNDITYHMNYIFEDDFNSYNLPPPLPQYCDYKTLEEYSKEYKGISILAHPTWKDSSRNSSDTTFSLMKSGICDAMELLNGASLDTMKRYFYSRKYSRMRKQAKMFKNGAIMYKDALLELYNQNRNLAALGNSDAHRPNLIGKIYTEFKGEKPKDVFQAIKEGKTKTVCNTQGYIKTQVKAVLKKQQLSDFIKMRK